MTVFTTDDLEYYFTYLDQLRESGQTNMYGGAQYLRSVYPELSKEESGKVLTLWMETFDNQNTVSERVQKVKKERQNNEL